MMASIASSSAPAVARLQAMAERSRGNIVAQPSLEAKLTSLRNVPCVLCESAAKAHESFATRFRAQSAPSGDATLPAAASRKFRTFAGRFSEGTSLYLWAIVASIAFRPAGSKRLTMETATSITGAMASSAMSKRDMAQAIFVTSCGASFGAKYPRVEELASKMGRWRTSAVAKAHRRLDMSRPSILLSAPSIRSATSTATRSKRRLASASSGC
mmetsp:Transcript_36187/g.79049  ORF Transcript_36187/g.79049 Transcript_36187/m.79049 type:complete len:214 (+) Transcript_36187:1013-1654(+)